jgi:ABC-2 type transport system ATP-binding protein
MSPADGEDGRIVIEGLSKSFGPIQAVRNLSFTVEPGSVAGFLGPNGAGKTTTLRTLLGLVRPDAGMATVGGRSYPDLARPNDLVGAVLETSGYHPARSGRDHLRIHCTVNGYPLRRADEVLEVVGLAEAARRRVGAYSLGMRQRLALATALLGNPGVLIADEPANGLDPEGIAWIRGLLRDLARQGRTVLISSHQLFEIQQLVDHVVIIDHGRLVAQGPLAELTALHGPVVSVHTPHADALAAALMRGGGVSMVERTGPDSLRVVGIQAVEIGRRAFAARIELHGLVAEQVDLEQVFLALTAVPGQGPETRDEE